LQRFGMDLDYFVQFQNGIAVVIVKHTQPQLQQGLLLLVQCVVGEGEEGWVAEVKRLRLPDTRKQMDAAAVVAAAAAAASAASATSATSAAAAASAAAITSALLLLSPPPASAAAASLDLKAALKSARQGDA